MNTTKLLVLDCKTNILRKFTGRQFIEAAVLDNKAEDSEGETLLEVWLMEIEEFRKD